MFKKEIEILEKEKKIIITVSGKKRRFITEERCVFKENISSLIPEEYKNKINLLSKPNKYIANFESKKYSISGEWVYEIKQEEKKQTKTQTTRRTRKKQTEIEAPTEEQINETESADGNKEN